MVRVRVRVRVRVYTDVVDISLLKSNDSEFTALKEYRLIGPKETAHKSWFEKN